MSIWRMAFKDGSQGQSFWNDLKEQGVAAITYTPLERTDLSKYPKDEPHKLWSRLSPTQKGSLRKVAYNMKPGDTIYVKDGTSIVGKGTIVSKYFFDDVNCIISKDGIPWSHQVRVQWQTNFQPVKVLLGAEQHTVKELSEDLVSLIENDIHQVQDIPELTAIEGNSVLAKHLTFERSSTFIRKIKERALSRNKMLNCQVCGFSFFEKYGKIGIGFIEAHHIKPLSEIKQQTLKTESDILLVCSNCHRMLHLNSLAIHAEELKLLIK
jgi:predicted HNH restriction endonuclease